MRRGMPWTKFWWQDWERDPCLRVCSFAAKGLWMDMLCRMSASDEPGYLVVKGRPASDAEVAKMVGGERRQVARLLGELETNGVLSRDERGAIFCRRMARDSDQIAQDRRNGAQGGNPQLKQNSELDEKGVNPQEAEAKKLESTPSETTFPQVPSEAPPPPADPTPPEGWLFDPPPRPAPAEPPTAREVLWREGLPILRALIGKSEQQTRALLGQLLRDMADDCPAVLAQIRAAHDLQPAEPVAWLRRSCTSPEVRRRAEMAEVDRGMWRGKPITAHNRPPSALVGGLG